MKKILLLAFFSLFFITVTQSQFVAMPLNFPWDTSAYLTYWTSIVDANIVWVGTARQKFLGYISYAKAIKTSDGGNTWQFYDIPVPGHPWIQHLSAWDANLCYYLFTDGATAGGSVWKTTDGGTSWNKMTTSQFNGGWANVIHAFSADTVVAVGDPNGGYPEVQFSPDGGSTWTRIPSTDIPASISGETGTSGEFCAVGNSIWIPTSKGRCYYSHDKGLHWGVATVTNSYIRIAFTSEESGIAFRPGTSTGMLVTSDGGATWNPELPSVLLPLGSMSSVPGIYNGYVATGNDTSLMMVYFSHDAFKTCSPLDSNIHNASFINFFSPTIGWLGGSYNPIHNIHKYIGAITSVPEVKSCDPKLTISPNPATDRITVSLNGFSASSKTSGINILSVISLTGIKVIETKFTGSSSTVDISRLPAGIYIVTVYTDNQKAGGRKLIIKN